MNKLLLAFAVVFLASCGNPRSVQVESESVKESVVTVYYFHGKQRCVTCRSIETCTQALLESEFQQAQKDKLLVYKVVDFSTPEGERIADRYEVAWSSLVVEKDGEVENLTDMAFAYAKSQPEVFKSELRDAIQKRLN